MSNNETNSVNNAGVNILVDAIEDVRQISQCIVKSGEAEAIYNACNNLLESCRKVCNAEVCAVFLVRGDEVLLEAQVGYDTPPGFPIRFDKLSNELKYKIGLADDSKYDGIIGFVASTGKEFSADSWDEIRQYTSHAGKPDSLNIWNENRPFRCVFAVPLISDGKTIGVLKVENKRDTEMRGDTFSDLDKRLLRILAHLFSQELVLAGFRSDKGRDSGPSNLASLAQKLDFHHMREVIENLPRQIEIALEQDLPSIPKGPFKGAFVVGMGGSALPVDVITTAFQEHLKIPLSVVRNYELPPSVTSDHLIIASSFSGGTEETLAAIEHIPNDANNIICLTAGGRLRDLAKERGYPLILMNIEKEPPGFQPRSAVGYFVTYLARVLSMAGAMSDAREEIANIPHFLRSVIVSEDAEKIARWLQDKIPIIYCDEKYHMAIARTAKIKFNENAKRPAFFNALPEANHNEMIGFTAPLGRFGILYLHDQSSHSRINRRFEVMEQVFAEGALNHVSFYKWNIPGETKLQKIFAALAFAELCSYDLALLEGFDPTPVDMVEKFKIALVK